MVVARLRKSWRRAPAGADLYFARSRRVSIVFAHSFKQRSYESVFGWNRLVVGVLVCAVAIAIVLEAFGFSQANLLAIFILADFLCALFARHWLQALFSWGLCVFIFGYRFAHPVSSLIMFDRGYLVVFGVMLILSLLVSKLSIRLRAQASISEEAALQNALLYQASQKLQSLVTRSAIESYLVQEIGDFMDRPVVLYPNAQDSLAKPVFSKDPDPF